MIKAVVCGAGGKMGQRILHMLAQHPEIGLAGATEREGHPGLGKDAAALAGLAEQGVPLSPSLEAVIDRGDVVIDFTSPASTLDNVRTAATHGKAMVVGTTGLSGEMLKAFESMGRTTRCVFSPNMSVGVNVMFKIAGELAALLKDDYDMEILEVHHRLKKDAPSGTALRLARILAQASGRDLDKVGVYERKGVIGERSRDEIGIQTWRAGDITGEHTLLFGGVGERLELIHRAHNRDNFARGAVKAAVWVVGRPVGLYDMQDVLGLR